MKRLLAIVVVVFCAFTALLSAPHKNLAWAMRLVAQADSKACPDDRSGLKLPGGFCATIFADGIGHARHMVVAPNGVLYVNTWSGVYYGNTPPHEGGFLVALQDKAGTGTADVIERFGETAQGGGAGGVGIALYKNAVYAELNDRIVRYAISAGSIAPRGPGVTVLSGMPITGDHPMHPFLIDSTGRLYLDVATPSNACQLKNRIAASPGENPCTELKTRGGVWLYDANKTDQVFSPAERYATGIRNAEGFAMNAAGDIFVSQHGRDQLHANWPEFYKADQEATLPAEQIMLLKQGGDYGWPECYYDPFLKKLMLAPEYGGNGKRVGICAQKIPPVAVYPAHWGPNGMAQYDKTQFPERYRSGVFIAFHGSWDRAPYSQGGYNVVFQPLAGERSSGRCEIFADGFAGSAVSPEGAIHRPSGLAVAPDGALFISDDVTGRIYRVTYHGGVSDAGITPCPVATAPAGAVAVAAAKPPEGTQPDAARASAIPAGATAAMVTLGERIYRGQEGGASCSGCHGGNATGTPLGPDLTAGKWVWSDGSYAGIAKTITDGVPQPKNYRSPMPPMGGTRLTTDQANALAAYLWSLNHGTAR